MTARAGRAVCAVALAALVAGSGCGGGAASRDGATDSSDSADGRMADALEDGTGVDATQVADANSPEAGGDASPEASAGDAGGDADGPPPPPAVRWVSLGAPSAGNVSALAIATDGTLFAGVGPNVAFETSVGTGIFTSHDSGASWQPRNEGLTNFNVQAFALSAGPLLAATKSVVRSVDGGLTWAQSLASSEAFTMVAADPVGAVVFASDQYPGGGLRRSEDGGVQWNAVSNPGAVFTTNAVAVLSSIVLAFGDNGLARSTDGGKTFQSVSGQTGTAFPDQILPNLLCRGGRCYLSGTSGFVRSTDQGATWSPVGQPSYFPLAVTSAGAVYVRGGSALARSDDGGDSWVTLPAPPLSPTVLAANGNDVYAGTARGIFRSQDKGGTWVAANGSVAAGALTMEAGLLIVDTSSAALSPNGDIYVGAFNQGLLRSVDDGATWSLVKVGFVPSSCVVTEAAGITCIGGSTYVRSKDHGVTWQPWSVPDFTDRFGTELDAVTARGETVYVSGKSGLANTTQIARSDDGGLTFHVLATSPEVSTLQVLGNGHVFGNNDVSAQTYRSIDNGATWTLLSSALSLPLTADGSGVLYRGSGEFLQSSTDDGDTWGYVDTHQTLALYNEGIGPIWFDGTGAMYLATEGPSSFPFTVGTWNLYVSTDLGQHWVAFPARLPHPAVAMAVLDKRSRLLVATNGGVYRLE